MKMNDGDYIMWSSQLDTQSEDDDDGEEVEMLPTIPENPSKEETMFAIQTLTTCIVLSIDQLWDNRLWITSQLNQIS